MERKEGQLRLFHGNAGIVRTKEQRLKISEGTKEAMAILPAELKYKIGNSNRDGHVFRGHNHTEENKELLRQIALSQLEERSRRVLRDKNPMYGRYDSLNPNWKGGYKGRYPASYWQMRPYILERDNYTCQLCSQEGNLVHHIFIDHWRNNEDELVAVCPSCNGHLQNKKFYKKTRHYLIIRAGRCIARQNAKDKMRQIFG